MRPGPVNKIMARVFAVLSVALLGCSNEPSQAPVPATQPTVAPIQAAMRQPTAADKLTRAVRLSEAITIVGPTLGDVRGDAPGVGAVALSLWAADHLRWSDLERMPDSRFGDVMKDPAQYRGKRLCIRGTISQIQADRSAGPLLYTGGVVTSSANVVRFVVVKSTGKLVENDAARICGVITGLQSFDNVMGGVTNAIHVVGMFDLPENKG